jgi:hypothetical protein
MKLDPFVLLAAADAFVSAVLVVFSWGLVVRLVAQVLAGVGL